MADWRCPDCGWTNREFSDLCVSCGLPRPTGAGTSGTTDASASTLHSPPLPPIGVPPAFEPGPGETAAFPVAPTAADAQGEPFGNLGLSRGIVFAVAAAIVASAIWYAVVAFSSLQIGFVASAVGWLVGTAAVVGARGRGSVWLAGVSVLLTVLALGVSEYLIAYHMTTRDLGVEFSLLQPPDVIFEIVLAVLQNDPVTLAFWAFAVALAGYIPLKAIRPAEPGGAVGRAQDPPQE